MSIKDDEFLRELRTTFKVEAAEQLQVIAAGLLKLDKLPASETQHEVVETVFRAAHSLKGASRAVEYRTVESLCQSLEDVFASWKRQHDAPPLDALDTLHQALDAITAIIASPEGVGVSYANPDLPELRRSLRQLGAPAPESSNNMPAAPAAVRFTAAPPKTSQTKHALPPATTKGDTGTAETVRVAVSKLELRMLEAEEMITAKLAARQRVIDLEKLADRFSVWRKAWTEIEPDARRLRNARSAVTSDGDSGSPELTRLLDFLDASLDTLKALGSQTAEFGKLAERDRYAVGKLVDDMLEDSKKMLLLPFAAISAAFPKLVRDQCRDQRKVADLAIHGDDVEIDKHILEEMKDPLVHLLRNSVDHGIEPPDERARRGKPARA